MPNRSITAFSQGLAILMDEEIRSAIINDPIAMVMPAGLPMPPFTELANAIPAMSMTKNIIVDKKLVLRIVVPATGSMMKENTLIYLMFAF